MFNNVYFKIDGSEPTVLAEVNTTCRLTSLSVWAYKAKPGGVDIKPDEAEIETAGESTSSSTAKPAKPATAKPAAAKPVTTKSAAAQPATSQPRAKILKRARQPGQDGISIVKSSSGEFIAEPIVKRKNSRKLSFAADVA